MSLPVLIVIILVSASIFVNGWTDSPNAIATVIATRVLKPRTAIMLGALFNFIGVFMMGSAVAATTATIVDLGSGTSGLITLAAAQIAIVTWSVSAWKFGIPTSESHALIAGLMGAGMSVSGLDAFNLGSLLAVLYGILISTVIGFLGGYGLTALIRFLTQAIGVTRRKANRFFSGGQVVSASLMAFSHGAQDGQKFMGILFLALVLGGVVAPPQGGSWEIPVYLMIFCSSLMAIGTSVGGYRIIKTVGMEMVQLEKYEGFGAELAASSSMIAATVWGIPLSTTNTKACAMMGAGASRGIRHVNWNVAKEMIFAWVLTFPACMAMGYLFSTIFRAIAGLN